MKEKALRAAGLVCLLLLINSLNAQGAHLLRRDHLTPQEADLVREAQELEKRTQVFIKAAERRLAALTNTATALPPKEIEKWGELKGTRAHYLYDLSKILDEAITNIDDVSARDERNPQVPKSVRRLSELATRVHALLLPMREQVAAAERSSLEQALENAGAILEASGRLPPPTTTKGKKKDI